MRWSITLGPRHLPDSGNVPFFSDGGGHGVIRHAPPLVNSKGTGNGNGECNALRRHGRQGQG